MSSPSFPPQSLADALSTAPASAAASGARQLLRAAGLPVAVAALLLALWSAAAPLSGAVIAPAQVQAEGQRKPIQHAEGGILRDVMVREGQAVRAGQPLLTLSDAPIDTALRLLQDQRRALLARIARADAEVAGRAQMQLPAELASDPDAATVINREAALLAAHRRSLNEQLDELGRQLAAADAQARALEAQITSTQAAVGLSDEELTMNSQLAEQGYVNRSRLISLQRQGADYAARLAENRGNLAAVVQRRSEIRARQTELRLALETQAAQELRETSVQLRDVEERLALSRDQAQRLTVRAPVDGRVMNLKMAAPGAPVGPRELLLEIVPTQEKLVLDARIAPEDVQQLRLGAPADVKLLGSAWQHAAPLPGRVSHIAPDRTTDAATGQAWFAAIVEVPPDALPATRLAALHPGVPAEVYVTTGARSLLDYLIAPLDLFRRRALREP